jgi:Family of unknown function (DUF6580)
VNRVARQELWLFAAIVAFGVLGRWLQPQWNFTPTAALALFAGYMFRHRGAACLAPLAILAISDLILPTHNNAGEMAAVYACFLAPAALGGLLRRKFTWPRLAASSLAPSVIFFVVTNFVVWLYRRGTVYDDSLAGLLDCYAAAILFFRWMLAGDVFFAAAIFGAYALAVSPAFRRAERVKVEID